MGAGTFLKLEEADIALLTEVDAGSRRSKGVSQLEVMATESTLDHYQFFPTRNVGTSINEGNAVLSRFPITAHRSYSLRSNVNPRVLGETEISLSDNKKITVLVAHLALGERSRETQLAEIAAYVKDHDSPLVLGGDFNERDHRSFKILKKAGLTPVSLAGYPSWKPVYALQVLFHSHHFTNVHASLPVGARFSDHLPLIVETDVYEDPIEEFP